jgi:hypothetical protein
MKKFSSYGGVQWLEFSLLQRFPQVRHAVFLRGNEFNLGEGGKATEE